MAAGKPVIATAHGGSVEIVEDSVTGYLVPPNRADLLAEKMLLLAKHSDLRQKMGEQGRKRARALFSENLFGQRIEAVIRESFGAISSR
jgi:glycosyltransferase involved in cell wall biosynthesis